MHRTGPARSIAISPTRWRPCPGCGRRVGRPGAPTAARGTRQIVTLDGGALPDTDPVFLDYNYVDPAFFDTVDVPVIRGRGFRDEDAADGSPAALITETAARQLWPGQDPLGKRFVQPIAPDRQYEVIGVVRDARLSVDISRIPAVVLWPFGHNLPGPATLHVYTDGPPTPLASAVTAAMRRRDPTLAIFGITSMDSHVYGEGLLAVRRLWVYLLGAFGAPGLLCLRRSGSTPWWRTR